MAISCLHENCIFGNSNFTRAHIAQLVEHFHGKEEVACSIHAVGTTDIKFFLSKIKKLYKWIELRQNLDPKLLEHQI